MGEESHDTGGRFPMLMNPMENYSMAEFSWLTAVVGGILIGVSSTILLAWNGRIAGISGMVHMLVTPKKGDVNWRWAFLIGLLGGGALYEYVFTPVPTPTSSFAPVAMILGGLIVGFGGWFILGGQLGLHFCKEKRCLYFLL
ncbi:hypothetical protein KFU94_67075 [Chloroflexi bacterium TSY]|nr:hypothetical protein [Chloroflexi bacterium TSY]